MSSGFHPCYNGRDELMMGENMDQTKLKMLIQAAKMYYQEDYNQQEIANQLGVSRPTVSRLLQQAKEEGIVRIEIVDPSLRLDQLAAALKERYRMKKVLIVPVHNYDEKTVKKMLGRQAALYLDQIVADGDLIGVAWGTTLYQVALHLKHKPVNHVHVVQLKGGVSYSAEHTYASEIMQRFGQAYGTIPHYLPLPAIVDKAVVKEAIEADKHIQKLLKMGRQANIAVYTVGEALSDSLLFRLGYLNKEELELLSAKAVGDICSRFYDENGKICDERLNQRTIGIELDELRKKEHSVLVAGGLNKVKAIRGALQGRYANVLITDQHTARLLHEQSGGENE
jgi:deoxyribonucleoside regulator